MNELDDEAVLRPRRPAEEGDLDITPMIDITFLLLIFFLVASKMSAPGKVTLPPARNGVDVVDKNAVIVTVVKSGDSVKIMLGDSSDSPQASGATPEEQDESLKAYVSKEILGKEYLLIKAEKDIKHRDIARVTRAVAAVEELQQLFVAVLEVK